MKSPWQTTSSKVIYTNPWIHVREDEVITPKGNAGIYGVVEAKPALGIVPLTEDLTQGGAQPDPTEELEVLKLPFIEAWQMVLEQEIKDSLAITGLMRTYHLLQQQGKLWRV